MKHLTLIATLTTFLFLAAVPSRGGSVVESVIPGSPAAAARVQDGDHILRLNGQDIGNFDDLDRAKATCRPGDTVPLAVKRDDETLDLSLTFEEGPAETVSIGVRLTFPDDPDGTTEPTEGTVACLASVEDTYHIETMTRQLGLELADAYATLRACIERDARRVSSARAIQICENIFKVHCSGLELLAEIGEAQVAHCEKALRKNLGLKLEQYPGWTSCAQNEIFDRYTLAGEADDEICRSALLDHCGTNLDAALQDGQISEQQRAFIACCSADALDAASHGDDGPCPMIDDGFTRGPCRDRSLCVNRLNSEWISCSVLEEQR